MKVVLKNNWFAPGGQLFRKTQDSNFPTEVPDELEPLFPKSIQKVVEFLDKVEAKVEVALEAVEMEKAAIMKASAIFVDAENGQAERLDKNRNK